MLTFLWHRFAIVFALAGKWLGLAWVRVNQYDSSDPTMCFRPPSWGDNSTHLFLLVGCCSPKKDTTSLPFGFSLRPPPNVWLICFFMWISLKFLEKRDPPTHKVNIDSVIPYRAYCFFSSAFSYDWLFLPTTLPSVSLLPASVLRTTYSWVPSLKSYLRSLLFRPPVHCFDLGIMYISIVGLTSCGSMIVIIFMYYMHWSLSRDSFLCIESIYM